MNTFADYILNEKDYAKKLEIAYYLQKRTGIFFDNSVILKTELTRLFLKYSKLELDENLATQFLNFLNLSTEEKTKSLKAGDYILISGTM